MTKTYSREEFVKEFSPYANQVTAGTGLLPGTLLAQGILESSGNYNTPWAVGGSKLSQLANNFFGIKADKSWKGQVYNISTREVYGGKTVFEKDDFRKYDSVRDSIADYVSFLTKNPRYKNAGVFDAKTVKDQASAIQKAGYATDPNYAKTVAGVFDSVKGFISGNVEVAIGKVSRNILPTALVLVGVASIITSLIIKN